MAEAGFLAGEPFRRDRTRASDQVFQDLRLQIITGRLQRGDRLPSEKEMAAHYDVSSPTVREALRALSSMSLIEIRHGSGTYVSAETAKLLSSAMTAVVQLERVDLLSILDVSEALYLKAVRRAAEFATAEDLQALRAAADRFDPAGRDIDFAEALSTFLHALVAVSHNPLLISLSGFLIDTQIALADEMTKRSPAAWREIAGGLVTERKIIVDALEAGDNVAAERALLAYTGRAEQLVRSRVEEQTKRKSPRH
ncbi:MAG: FadR/GntR family transcriptional regulator [Jatrophihabitans sp.]